jgi:ABC-type dipeptide/oligopeptide/nickel transport system ATPase subunit
MRSTPSFGIANMGISKVSDSAPILDIDCLQVSLFTRRGVLPAVDGLSLTVSDGETVAVVGESGCGKSLTALAVMRLLPWPPARIVGGAVRFMGRDLATLSDRAMQRVRGKDISMIFQEPMASLNPVVTVGDQLIEAVRSHDDISRKEAQDRAVELLRQVRIPDAGRRLHDFPHQMSGGMSQRVMIAMAIACGPKLLIADEPTTALDVTIQAQILDLLKELQASSGMGMNHHHPRSQRRRRDRRSGRGDVCWPQGRGGAGRGVVRAASASLYARSARRHALGDAAARHQAGRDQRRRSGLVGAAGWLRLPEPLSRCLRPLPRRAAGLDAADAGPDRGVFRRRRGVVATCRCCRYLVFACNTRARAARCAQSTT